MSHLVTVTGATGNIGRAIVRQLIDDGVHVRAVARSAGAARMHAAAGAETVAVALEDTDGLTAAFRGAHAVFVMIPQDFAVLDYAAHQRQLIESAIRAVENAGVRHAVALSALGAGLRCGPPVQLEYFQQRLADVRGLSTVVLRPAFLMENHLQAIGMISGAGINGGPFDGSVAQPMIAARDVAAVATGYLRAPQFSGFAMRDLLGPRDYTLREATALLGTAIGRPDLPYIELPHDDVRAALLMAGFSVDGTGRFLELAAAINDGRLQRLADRSVANTTPTTLEVFASEVFAPAWRAHSAATGRDATAPVAAQ